jgi:DNA ligase-1
VLRNVGGVYSCTCPGWRLQSAPIERRTCKHLKDARGAAVEEGRVGLVQVAKVPTAWVHTAGPPPLLLAHTWELGDEPTGWWMSEKLDGVRAYWNGQRFLSRLGHEYVAPPWFTAGLPSTPLDGELWAGRKQFQKTVSIARKQGAGHGWKELLYVVFDAPAAAALFEDRLDVARQVIAAAKNAHVAFHPQERCLSLAHLQQQLAHVESLGGEGLMLRRPGSRYEVGRSSTLLKVKTFKDAEARVLGQVEGSGKFVGMMGALEVELADGTKFSVGSGFTDDQRRAGYAPGTLITFRYQELSKDGVPRFPSFVGLRIDAKLTQPPAPKPAPSAVIASAEPVSALRRFEKPMSTGGSRFWEIELKGRVYRTAFGVVGGPTHRRIKRLATVWLAAQAALDEVAAKKARGFVEK